MTRLTESRLMALFALSLALLLGNALLAWRNMARVIENNRRVIESRLILAEVRGVLSTMKDAETGQRGYIITGRESYLEPYRNARRAIGPRLRRLRQQTATHLDQQSDTALLARFVNAKLKELSIVIDRRREDGIQAAAARVLAGRGKRQMDAIRVVAARIERREDHKLELRDREAQRTSQQTIYTFAFAATFDLLLLSAVFVLVRRDLSERRIAELRLIASRDEAERQRRIAEAHLQEAEIAREGAEAANRAKSDFIAGVSHELRTPLNAILGFSKLLLNPRVGPLNEDQQDYLRDVVSGGEHLLQLINDLLDVAKIEAGKLKLDTSPFSLADALETSLSVVREKARAHHIALRLDIAKEVRVLPFIVADRRKVRQILFNLLSNAVKFTPPGGSVTLKAELQNPNSALISVTDTGIGIPREELGRIWEAFEQIDGSYARKQQGTGLGLTLTRRMVELHGGDIRVESEEGRGSTFTFTLPLRFEGEDVEDSAENSETAPRTEGQPVAESARQPGIGSVTGTA